MLMLSSQRLLLIFILMLAGCSTVPESYRPVRSIAVAEVSHALFDAVLRAHVADGVVDYPGIAADARFVNYLDKLYRVDAHALPTRAERLAFWINAYNAFAIKGILDGYSPRTLLGRYRYFIARKYDVGGERINLYDIEQKILIPEFNEPRIHFAIVCASASCPKLRSQAYTADQLETQLAQSAHEFINDPTRNRFDHQNKRAQLSEIFKWFEQDFAANAGSLSQYVGIYLDADLASDTAGTPYKIEFLEYDWSLNGIPHANPR
jgi:hypothetical protein